MWTRVGCTVPTSQVIGSGKIDIDTQVDLSVYEMLLQGIRQVRIYNMYLDILNVLYEFGEPIM